MARVFTPSISEGVNKRAREDDHEEVEHKLTRDHLRDGSSRDAEVAFKHRRGFLASFKTKILDDNSDDATSTDSKMDLEDDAIDDNDITLYAGKSAPLLHATVKIDMQKFELKTDAIDAFVHTMKGGKLQYIRKIDFLVDDLVRKTNRTLNWAGGSASELCCIPSSIGPHPGTDSRFLSPGAKENDSETSHDSHKEGRKKLHSSSGKIDMLAPLPATYVSDSGLYNGPFLPTKSSKLSGDLSHCDWPIEEISG